MAKLMETRTLPLTPPEWAALEEYAVKTDSKTRKGRSRATHSWREFVRRLCAGEFVLQYTPPPRTDLERIDAAIEALEAKHAQEGKATPGPDLPVAERLNDLEPASAGFLLPVG
jgi:hypothetical protein